MSAGLSLYFGGTYVVGGQTVPFGALGSPFASTTLPGTNYTALTVSTIQAGAIQTIHSYNNFGRFSFFACWIIGTGSCYGRYLSDRGTSASDFTPAGTLKRWYPFPLNTTCPFMLGGDQIWVDSSTAANDLADSSGSSALSAPVTGEVVNVYQVQLKNFGTTSVQVGHIALY